MDIQTLISLIFIGLTAGILAGFIGIGGGIIIVPALIYVVGLNPLMAQGTSLALMLPPIGILAFMQYYKAGNANLTYGAIVAVTFILGGYFGAKYAQKMDEDLMKVIFGGIMILIAIKMIAGGWVYFTKNG